MSRPDVVLNTLDGLLAALEALSGVERPTVVNTEQGIGYGLDLGRYASRARVASKESEATGTSALGANEATLITSDLDKYRLVRSIGFRCAAQPGTGGVGGDVMFYVADQSSHAVPIAASVGESGNVGGAAGRTYIWLLHPMNVGLVRIPPGWTLSCAWNDDAGGHAYVADCLYDESPDAVIYE